MKPGINQWAFPAGMPAIDCISMAKRAGFESFEVCVGEQGPTPLDVSDADIAAIRRHAEAEGITLHSVASGAGWQYQLTSADEANRTKAADIIRRSLQIAHGLGAKALLVVPGVVDANTPYDVALNNASSGVRELAPFAEKLEVAIAIENVWNKFLLSPAEMRGFIDRCESPYVGAYIDVGNMIPYGYPEQWIRILGRRVKAIHMKDFRASVGTFGGFVMLLEGDVNWPAVMAALREVRYDGALTAEYGAYPHSLEALLEHIVASMRAIVKM